MLNLKAENNIILGASCPEDIDDEVIVLAQRLSKVHGPVKIFSESGGVHIYIASPICLELYGPSELQTNKMHLAINADKFLGRAPYDEPNEFSALCMKTGEIYNVSELLAYKNLESRGYRGIEHHVAVVEKTNNRDENGNPFPPGDVVSILDLPDDHPAIVYLKSRDFCPKALVEHFNVQFCTKAREGAFFRSCGYGFSTSPKNRIIFNMIVDGETKGWQSRILEIKAPDSEGAEYKYFYHTEQSRWFPVFKKVDGEWEQLPGFNGEPEKWDPAKYILGFGTRRNQYLMGYDSSKPYDWIGLTEGALDAARLRPPFCAVMGKTISFEQAGMCRNKNRVVLAIQNDEASEQFRVSVMTKFRDLGMPIVVVRPPKEYGDYGDMSQSVADAFLEEIKLKYSI
jgi:hypothetical protein